VEVTIGLQHIARELSVDVDTSTKDLTTQLELALGEGSNGLFELTDTRGRVIVVPAKSIGYVEIGPEETRRVGFGSL